MLFMEAYNTFSVNSFSHIFIYSAENFVTSVRLRNTFTQNYCYHFTFSKDFHDTHGID